MQNRIGKLNMFFTKFILIKHLTRKKYSYYDMYKIYRTYSSKKKNLQFIQILHFHEKRKTSNNE